MYRGRRIADKIYLFYLRSGIKHPGSKKIQRFITKHIFNSKLQVISKYNSIFLLNTFDYIDQMIIRKNNYESQSIDACFKILRNGGVFIDVGANFGLYSINLMGIPNLRIVAIEPNPITVSRLVENAEINHSRNIEIITTAIGDKNDIVGLYCPSINNSGNFQVTSDNKRSRFLCPQLSLNYLFMKLKITTVDLLKVDVEGYEKYVLNGLNFNLIKPKNILLEIIPKQLNNFSCTEEEIFRMLKENGYSIFDINGHSIVNLRDITESNVLFSLDCNDS